jgi:hypothetical protein
MLLGVALLALTACGGPDKDAVARSGAWSIVIGIRSYAVDHGDSYPASRLVRSGGPGMEDYDNCRVGTYVVDCTGGWPTNPFTGKPMQPGESAGDFTYQEIGATGWRLTLYGKRGAPLAVYGDGWDSGFSDEMSQLLDAIRDWAKHHHGAAPPTAYVTQQGLGAAYAGKSLGWWWGVWPVNPFNGAAVHVGTQPGDYTYTRLSVNGYRLVGYNQKGRPFTVQY